MSYKIVIELSDRDLRYFRGELRRAREAVGIADDEEILAAAVDLVETLRRSDLPDFVKARLTQIETLVSLLGDTDWSLDESERSPVLAALAYLCDPEDIIPDSLPGIGLLDDAVMIELVFRQLRHEIDAYEDFRRFRAALPKALSQERNAEARAVKLGRRRAQLVARMRRRLTQERERGSA